MKSFTVHCRIFNAISDLYQPDARSNMSPTCDYQNWLQVWPNVFLGSKIKTWMRSMIFKTFFLLVSLSLHAIDVFPERPDVSSPAPDALNRQAHVSADICMCSWSWDRNPSWLEGAGSFLRSSRSIYQYHNKSLPKFRLPPPRNHYLCSHFLKSLSFKAGEKNLHSTSTLIHHLDPYLFNMNLKQVSTTNVQH